MVSKRTWNTREVRRMTGLSNRTIEHYDNIGLLDPNRIDTGNETRSKPYSYREFTQEDMLRLFMIRIYKQLGYTLKDIKTMLDNPTFDTQSALRNQVELLKEKIVDLQMEQMRVQAQIALIEYLERTGLGERTEVGMSEDDIREELYLLFTYPEYRWILEVQGAEELASLLESNLDRAEAFNDGMQQLQRNIIKAAQEKGGKLSEAEEKEFSECSKSLVADFAGGMTYPELAILGVDLGDALANSMDPHSEHVQAKVGKAAEGISKAPEADPERILFEEVDRLERGLASTYLLLRGMSESEQGEMAAYYKEAVRFYFDSHTQTEKQSN